MATQAYSMKVNRAAKTVEMMVAGTFTPQDYESFVKDYASTVGSIQATEYKLEVDCTEMSLLNQTEVEKLKTSFASYKQSGFHKVVLILTQAQLVNKMQLNRVAKDAGLTNIEFTTK
ncbi:hypothetical protein [Paenibacillus soyae]|uniref:STAS domain-containing protein n=1 Tax=Paenibacillus soyae TaxID=2969249 RepID=A0A9X2SDB1_9BACL|nr:hypothetical protein [Paenibacillus soyae]MCR2806902.1 hypothetical protein [Paenibacillus soyae]